MKKSSSSVTLFPSLLILCLLLLTGMNSAMAADGKSIFKQNCGACHTTTKQKLVGPGLEGIADRRKDDWLHKWIRDSQGFIKSGDADAKALFEAENKTVMPPFAALTDDELNTIIAYIKSPEPEAVAAAPAAAMGVNPNQPQDEPSNPMMGWVVAILCFIGGLALLYIYTMKQKLRTLGYAIDKVPVRDRVSEFGERNGKLILVAVIFGILYLLFKWTSSM